MKTTDKYAQHCSTFYPTKPSVYLLWQGDRCVYVGCTTKIMQRLSAHNNRWELDKVEIEQFETLHEARVREKFLIALHHPPDNIQRGFRSKFLVETIRNLRKEVEK